MARGKKRKAGRKAGQGLRQEEKARAEKEGLEGFEKRSPKREVRRDVRGTRRQVREEQRADRRGDRRDARIEDIDDPGRKKRIEGRLERRKDRELGRRLAGEGRQGARRTKQTGREEAREARREVGGGQEGRRAARRTRQLARPEARDIRQEGRRARGDIHRGGGGVAEKRHADRVARIKERNPDSDRADKVKGRLAKRIETKRNIAGGLEGVTEAVEAIPETVVAAGQVMADERLGTPEGVAGPGGATPIEPPPEEEKDTPLRDFLETAVKESELYQGYLAVTDPSAVAKTPAERQLEYNKKEATKAAADLEVAGVEAREDLQRQHARQQGAQSVGVAASGLAASGSAVLAMEETQALARQDITRAKAHTARGVEALEAEATFLGEQQTAVREARRRELVSGLIDTGLSVLSSATELVGGAITGRLG